MIRVAKSKIFWAAPVMAAALHANSALACAACYGKASGPLVDGMNDGIFFLLGTVVCVLAGVAGVGIYLVKKSAAAASVELPAAMPTSTQKA
jgi:hypothetical protein